MSTMFYSVRHLTRFLYNAPISESTMVVHMQPRSELGQRCVQFELSTSPRARVYAYRDHLGNVVHHFDIPARHTQLRITAEATVEVSPSVAIPEALGPDAWNALDSAARNGENWEYLKPSVFVDRTAMLDDFAKELALDRTVDPLSLLLRINAEIFHAFQYTPQSTQVDSPIDDALRARRGVCQDFAHIMLALVRPLGIPARYVSGYLYQGEKNRDRSEVGASHAWIEAWLPQLGWIGFDPTNNLVVEMRHVITAAGRDYSDVPPTRGVFKGTAASELSVAVVVSPSHAPRHDVDMPPGVTWVPPEPAEDEDEVRRQQQQQQQQQ
ncbi:MAG: transglutaminase family protein [Acidobacteriota bacterium]